MKQNIKRILLTITFLLTAIFIVSCTSVDGKLDKALDGIKIEFATGDSITSVTKDIVLPSKSGEVDITWVSRNTSRITPEGKVFGGTKDEQVVLVATATIKEEAKNKEFTLTVKESGKAIVAMAKDRLILAGVDNNTVNGDVVLADKVVIDGKDVVVTWATSDKLVMEADGTVYRPAFGAANASVILTATLTYGSETENKEFNLTVTAKTVEPDVVGTVDHVSSTAKKDDWVRVPGVTVTGFSKDGFYVSDSTGSFFVYLFGAGSKVSLGNVYDMEGQFDNYFGTFQIKPAIDEPLSFSPSTEDVTVLSAVEETLAEINLRSLPSVQPLNSEYITVEGIVHIEGDGNYNTFLMPAEGYEGTLDKSKALLFYYQGNVEAVREFAGEKIKVSAFLQGYRDDHEVWYVTYTGTAEDIEILEQTPAEAFASAKGILSNTLKAEYIEDEVLDLPIKVGDVDVSWASDKEAIINPTTGVLSLPTGAREIVTLTATLSFGGETDTLVLSSNVGNLEVTNLEDVLEADKGLYYKAEGTLIAHAGNGTYSLQDDTGAIVLYSGTYVGSFNDELLAGLGKKVTVIGKKDIFNGLHQLGSLHTVNVATEEGIEYTPVDISNLLEDQDELVKHQSKLVSVLDAFVTKVTVSESGSGDSAYEVVEVTLLVNGKTINVRSDGRVTFVASGETNPLAEVTVGEKISIVGAVLGWYRSAQVSFTNVDQLVTQTQTDAIKAEYAHLALEFVEEARAQDVVDLPAAGLLGSTITWAVDNLAVAVIADNKVTFADVTAATTVTFTATVKVGDVTLTKEFEVLVKVATGQADLLSYVFDFGETQKTGYDTEEFTFTNGDNVEYTLNKKRVQISNSDFAPHTDQGMFAIFSARAEKEEAYLEFDLTSYAEIAKIEFVASVWNNNSWFDEIVQLENSTFELQFFDGTNWVAVESTDSKTNQLTSLVKDVNAKLTFDVSVAGLYRVYYNAPGVTVDRNTNYAVTMDDFTVYYAE